MKSQIEQLEHDIQYDREQIKAKKQMIAVLKQIERKNVMFGETSFGKFLYGALRTCTKPFARLHKDADDMLVRPKVVLGNQLLKKAHELIKEAATHDRETDEKAATIMTAKLGEFVMTWEDYFGDRPIKDTLDEMQTLRAEIERLRPPKDEKVLEEFRDTFSKLYATAFPQE